MFASCASKFSRTIELYFALLNFCMRDRAMKIIVTPTRRPQSGQLWSTQLATQRSLVCISDWAYIISL
ncbi:hypothetical protein SAMN04490203_2538 [Pseudomonas taetrolens]|uniref:Uncharacterized protein n=1 Tax=Pseudomonas taetrolens TaxID=47884 RepID=A0A1H4T1V9_PSETA|nr:hypothetical protein SAMN04490203_2538 [Pseudomonas taetrolens]SQF86689.1 Uncharacterised protein [Pseudomonas taetrolens]VEH49765.1 Uncharacterised protein [Pseudomonas taetrolens]